MGCSAGRVKYGVFLHQVTLQNEWLSLFLGFWRFWRIRSVILCCEPPWGLSILVFFCRAHDHNVSASPVWHVLCMLCFVHLEFPCTCSLAFCRQCTNCVWRSYFLCHRTWRQRHIVSLSACALVVSLFVAFLSSSWACWRPKPSSSRIADSVLLLSRPCR